MKNPIPSYTAQKLHEAERRFAANHNLAVDALNQLNRLREKQESKLMTTVRRDVALWIVAPVLAGFAHWMKEQGQIYEAPLYLGVMREGRLLSRLMKALFDIPAREVWLNRNLAMLAAFGTGDDEALINWLVRTRLKPISRGTAIFTLLGEVCHGEDAQVPMQLKDASIMLRQDWMSDARRRAAQLADRLLVHWHNTLAGLPARSHIMLMDFACAGNIQRSLQTILAAKNISVSLTGLNFITTAGSAWAEKAGCFMQGYLAEKGSPAWLADAYARTPELIEIFTACPVGPLEGYGENGQPFCGKFLVPEQESALCDLQDEMINAAAFYYHELGGKLAGDLGRCLWGRLLISPLPVEVEALADWPLDAGLENGAQRFLAPFLPEQAEPWTRVQTAWPAASRLRNRET